MGIDLEKYEVVIGLEIHTQLLTQTKAFSEELAEYGAMPNSNISVVNLGHPGTLPRHNKEAVNMALKVGIACGCDITPYCLYARKNYFYADLPKGYQITQDKTPLCTNGSIHIKKEDGTTKDILLTRIHLEEDSGKSIHDMDMYHSLIDYNRAGTTLIEIVTEPVIKTGEEAGLFVTEVRKLVRYLDVCDGNMEEGSLRCDANISVMLKGSKTFGTKVEVKNMNSISNVRKAIEYEMERQVDILESGKKVFQETRSFDAVKGTTFSIRAKELATDYRYFPEPDLPPLIITEAWIKDVEASMPKLPKELYDMFTREYGLSTYDAQVLTENKEVAAYYLEMVEHAKNFKACANYLMGPVRGYLNKNAIELSDFVLTARQIADIIRLVDENVISNAAAEQIVLLGLIEEPSKTAKQVAEEKNVIQNSDDDFINQLVDEALSAYPDKVDAYKNGKTGLLGLFMGEVMKRSGGKADPKVATEILRKKLNA